MAPGHSTPPLEKILQTKARMAYRVVGVKPICTLIQRSDAQIQLASATVGLILKNT